MVNPLEPGFIKGEVTFQIVSWSVIFGNPISVMAKAMPS